VTRQPVLAATRLVGMAGAGWGIVLIIRGDQLWERLTGRAPSVAEHRVIRLLAARHVGQGMVQAVAPHHFQRLWTFVDVTHAVTMAALAAFDKNRRAPAGCSGAIAIASGVATGWLHHRAR
jgi:hypothetical protein